MAEKIQMEKLQTQKANNRGWKKEIFAPVNKHQSIENGLSVDEQNKRLLDKLLSTRSGEELMNQLLSMFPGIHPVLVTASIGHVLGLKKLLHVVAGGINEIRHPKDGSTALHIAAKSGFTEATKFLLDAGTDPSISNNEGNTPFMVAIINGCAPVVNVLWHVRNRFGIDHANKLGQTAIHLAALRGWDSCINMLIGGGASKNKITMEGCTALMICSMRGDITTTKRLATNGANILLEDNEVSTSICLSIKKDQNIVAQYLLDKLERRHLEEYVKRRIQLLTILPDVEETYQFYHDVLYQVFHFLAHHSQARQLLYQYKLLSSWILAVYHHIAREAVTEKAFMHLTELMCLATQKDIDSRFVEQFLRYGGTDLVLHTMAYYRETASHEMVACTMLPLLPLAETAAGKKWLEQTYYKISESMTVFYDNRDDLNYPPGMKDIANTLWDKFSSLFCRIQAIQAELHGAELLAAEEREKERQKVRREKKREKKRQKRQRARSRSVGTSSRTVSDTDSDSDPQKDAIPRKTLQNPEYREVSATINDNGKSQPVRKSNVDEGTKNTNTQKPQKTEKPGSWDKPSKIIIKPIEGNEVIVSGIDMSEFPDSPFEMVLPKKKAKEMRKLRQKIDVVKIPEIKAPLLPLANKIVGGVNPVVKVERPKKKTRSKKTKTVEEPDLLDLKHIHESQTDACDIITEFKDDKESRIKTRNKPKQVSNERSPTPECWDPEFSAPYEVVVTVPQDENDDQVPTTDITNTVKRSTESGLNSDSGVASCPVDDVLYTRQHLSISLDNILLISNDHETSTPNRERKHHRRSRSDSTTLQLLWETYGVDNSMVSPIRSQVNTHDQRRTFMRKPDTFERCEELTFKNDCSKQVIPTESSLLNPFDDSLVNSSVLNSDNSKRNNTQSLQDNSGINTPILCEPVVDRRRKKKGKQRRKRSHKGTTQTLQQFLQSNDKIEVDATTYSATMANTDCIQPKNKTNSQKVHQRKECLSAWSTELSDWATKSAQTRIFRSQQQDEVTEITSKHCENQDSANSIQVNCEEKLTDTLHDDSRESYTDQCPLFTEDESQNNTLEDSLSFVTDISSMDDSNQTTGVKIQNNNTQDIIPLLTGSKGQERLVMHSKQQPHDSRSHSEKTPIHVDKAIVSFSTIPSRTDLNHPSYDFSSAVTTLHASMFKFGGHFPMLPNESSVSNVMSDSDPAVIQCATTSLLAPPPGFIGMYGNNVETPLLHNAREQFCHDKNNDKANEIDQMVGREALNYVNREPTNTHKLNIQPTGLSCKKQLESTTTSSPCAHKNLNTNAILFSNPNVHFQPIDPLWRPNENQYSLGDMSPPATKVHLPEPVSPEFAYMTADPDVIYDNDPEKDMYVMGHIKREWIGHGYFSPVDKLTELMNTQKELARRTIDGGHKPVRKTCQHPYLAGKFGGGGDCMEGKHNTQKMKKYEQFEERDSTISHFWLPSWILNE